MKANINKYEFSKLLSSYEERIKYLENENKELKNQNENLITENSNLVEQLNLFKSFIFASKSEKKVKKPQDNKQLLLFDEAELFRFNHSDDEVQKKMILCLIMFTLKMKYLYKKMMLSLIRTI